MARFVQGGASALPAPAEALAQLRAIVARLDYATLGLLVEAAIGRMDETDGDPEREPDGDEEDGTRAEDEPFFGHGFGPGCAISDSDHGEDGES